METYYFGDGAASQAAAPSHVSKKRQVRGARPDNSRSRASVAMATRRK